MKFWFFILFFFSLCRIIQVNSVVFVTTAVDLKLDLGASKAFTKGITPLCIFFKLIYATFWCILTDLSLCILFWIKQWAEFSCCSCIRAAWPPAFCRWINGESRPLKWGTLNSAACLLHFSCGFLLSIPNKQIKTNTSTLRLLFRACKVTLCLPLPQPKLCPQLVIPASSGASLLRFPSNILWDFYFIYLFL